jgi:hypothetical protein
MTNEEFNDVCHYGQMMMPSANDAACGNDVCLRHINCKAVL